MKLRNLIRDVERRAASGRMDAEVTGVCHDSRRVRRGDLFVALRGRRRDAAEYIDDAIASGAAAVIYEGEPRADLGVPSICTTDARLALAAVSAEFFGHPSRRLKVVGVTGTNGKTSTCSILRGILGAAGHRVCQSGTIGNLIGDELLPAMYTTPEAPEYQALLAEMLDAGCTHVVSEVSSHALDQRRADFVRYEAGVFTNLTREHLDYHVNMGGYYEAKRRFFEGLLEGRAAVINVDDPYGARLMKEYGGRKMSYAINSEADLRGTVIDSSAEGLGMVMTYKGGIHSVNSKLIGIVNAYNILAAAGAALALGVDWQDIARGVADVRGVPGRCQRVNVGQDFVCLVDYAHTGDALRRLIANARGLTGCRVITLFGCGGERDRGKRQEMGATSVRLSDLTIVTTDNPRGEDPAAIILDILAGVDETGMTRCRVIPDRAQAIVAAIEAAGPGDVVLIAGKGHEDYQEAGGVRREFSDVREAERAMAMKMRRADEPHAR